MHLFCSTEYLYPKTVWYLCYCTRPRYKCGQVLIKGYHTSEWDVTYLYPSVHDSNKAYNNTLYRGC